MKLDFRRFASVRPEFTGDVIRYAFTIPANAPDPELARQFAAFLLGPDGRRILEADHQPLLTPPELDDAAAAPEEVRRACAGTRWSVLQGLQAPGRPWAPPAPASPALMRGRRVSPFWALCAVAGVVLVTFVALPAASMIVGAGAGLLGEALRQDDVRRSLVLTVTAALITTVIGFVVGVPLAYLLARREFPGKRAIEGIIDLPIVFPHTAAGIALLTVYGRQGVVGRLLAPLGIEFTETVAGIVLAMLFVSLPFLVDGARESFALVDERYEHVARTLGSSRFGAFARVTFPQAWRGVLAGAVLMWGRGISEFGAVVILAYNPKVISVLTFERFEGFGLSAAQPPAVLIVIVAFVVFLLVRSFLVPRRRRSKTGAP